MDSELSNTLFNKELDTLKSVISEISPESEIIASRIVFVNILSIKNKKRYLLKIDCDGDFPLGPADYRFVNPVTKLDDGAEHWPSDDGQAFKINENPRWICLAGTRAYKNRHNEHQFDRKTHSLSQTVFHIIRQINGWPRVE